MMTVSISDAEWSVMQVVWQRRVPRRPKSSPSWSRRPAGGIAPSARCSPGWSKRGPWPPRRTAIATSIGRSWAGRSACGRKPVRFCGRVFSGDAAELVAHFVRDAKIPPEQIEELKRLLDENGAGR